MNITLREIDESNFVDAIRLEVKPEQSAYVATNAASIAQSKFHTFLECYGIYDSDSMVGFSAFGKHTQDGSAWIVRHMIGAEFQRRGYGRAGLSALIEHMREVYECSEILLDVSPGNQAALELYKDAGFADTGKKQGESIVLKLSL